MSVMEAIRNYICTCPFLKDGKIGVDYLGDSPREYTIDSVPSSEIIKTYVDGGTLRQCLFIFASREAYGPTARKNLENNGFYEDFAAWLEQQDAAGVYPDLGTDKIPQRIQALTCGYLFDGSAENARYQIQCRLVYYQD